MGHFISLCPAGPARALVGSRRTELLKLARWPETPDLAQRAEAILAGDLPGGDNSDAAAFIQAWERLCAAAVTPFTCVEIYDDPELFPEAFDFVWSGPEPPDLPVSTEGGAAVNIRRDVAPWIETFAGLDLDALNLRAGSNYKSELAELLRVLRDPASADGVMIFWVE